MKRQQLSIVILLFTIALLCSCGLGGQDEPEFNYIPKADEYYDETTPDIEKEANISAIEIRYIDSFSSGRAWIDYVQGDQSNRYLGCIDKNGKLLFSFEEKNIGRHTPFECGASYIYDRQSEAYYIISDQGEILTSSTEVGFEGIASYGDGYFLAYKNKEGFDSDGYLFLVIDSTGEIIKEINSKDCTLTSWEDFKKVATYEGGSQNNVAAYCGDGIFQFMKPDRMSFSGSKCPYVFYDIKTDMFFEKECDYSAYLTKVEDGICKLWVDGEYVLFDIASQTDNLEQVKYWEDLVRSNYRDVTYSCGPVSNGRMVYIFHNSYESHNEDPIYACAYADRTGMYPIETYREYMSKEWSGGLSFDQTADRLLIRFVGKDSNYYLAIIDSKGNTIMEPLKCDVHYSSNYFSCGRFNAGTEDNITIYDTDGNVVFPLNDIGGTSISEFSDDVAVIDRNKDSAKVVDINGNILFDHINTANNQFIDLLNG